MSEARSSSTSCDVTSMIPRRHGDRTCTGSCAVRQPHGCRGRLRPRAASQQDDAPTQLQEAVQAAKDTREVVKSDVAQLLGMKGAGAETNKWKIRLQLTKPVTWVPLVWGALLLPIAPLPRMLPSNVCQSWPVMHAVGYLTSCVVSRQPA